MVFKHSIMHVINLITVTANIMVLAIFFAVLTFIDSLIIVTTATY